jgi:hypothetical protein
MCLGQAPAGRSALVDVGAPPTLRSALVDVGAPPTLRSALVDVGVPPTPHQAPNERGLGYGTVVQAGTAGVNDR